MPPADALAAVAEASRLRAAANQRRVYVLAAVFALALIVAAGFLQYQENQVETFQHQQCLQRQANTMRSNQIWADLGAIEEHSRDDPGTREERLRVYRNAHLDVPICT